MIKKTKNIIRDFFHLFIGFSVLYIIGSYTDFDTYTLESKIIGCTSVSFILGGALGLGWELYQLGKKKIDKVSFKDVLITALGGLLGGLFSLWIADSFYFGLTFAIISAIMVFNDLYKPKK